MQAEMSYSQKPGSHSASAPQPLTHFPERLYGKSTRVIQVDFTGGLEIYETIEAGLKDLEIGVLGMSLCLLGEALLSAALGLTLTPEHSPGKHSPLAPPGVPGTVGVTQALCPLSFSKQRGPKIYNPLE